MRRLKKRSLLAQFVDFNLRKLPQKFHLPFLTSLSNGIHA